MAWNYIATRLNGDGTETHLDPEVPLQDVTITESRNAPTTISATVAPEVIDLVDASELPVLEKWSTMIYAEKDGDIRAGGILVDDSIDPATAARPLDFMGMAGYPNTQPYTEANTWPDNPPIVEYDEGLQDAFEDREVRVAVPHLVTVFNKKTGKTTFRPGWRQETQIQTAQTQWARDPAVIEQPVTGYPADGLEPMYAIREIWRHLQAQPGGNLGMIIDPMVTGRLIGKLVAQGEFDTENGPLSFEYEPFLLRWFETHDLGDVVSKLCESVPLEFREEHTWNAERNAITHFLRFGHPSLSRRRTDIRFVVGENVEPVGIDPPADEYASHIVGLGAGEGRTMVRGDAIRTAETRIRRALVYEDKAAKTQAAIAESARAELLVHIGVDEVAQIEVRPGHVEEVQHLMPGDEVKLVGDQPHRDLDMWVRIETKTTDCSNDGLQFGVQRADRLA